MPELKISKEEIRDEELNAILDGTVGEKVKTPEEYIKRSDVLKKAICLIQGPTGEENLRFCAVPFDDIQKIPAADVVSRRQYEQIKWERNMLSDQLAGRWIPVTERLPDVPGHVLVWDNTAKIRKILWFHDCNGWGVEDKHPKRYFGNASDQRRYTHWMALPEPPKEETE